MPNTSNQKKLKEVVLSKSLEQSDWFIARLEWEIYEIRDNESHDSVCLCDQHGLRWEYYLKNMYTKNTIMIGSSCIKWFDNPALNSIRTLFEKSDKMIEYWGKLGEYSYKGLSRNMKFKDWFITNYRNKNLKLAKHRNRRDELIAYLNLLDDYLK